METDKEQTKNRFHHVGIVVENISQAIEKFSIALGIDKDKVKVEKMSYMSGKGEEEEFKFAFLPLAKGENNFIELVEPTTPGPTARYLEKHGEGLFHLAFESSNITASIQEFERAGIPQAGLTPTEEVLSVFLHPKYAHGVLVQILKKGVFDGSGRLAPK
ncbi:MAG: VOC family protein [Candidatus Bathyarchaeota archaeon]|nr:MAG: VOC family protein [Candidatus Bathyarchaeota archaeon]